MNITRRQFTTLTVGALVSVTFTPSQVVAAVSDHSNISVTPLPQGIYEGRITKCCIEGESATIIFTVYHPTAAQWVSIRSTF